MNPGLKRQRVRIVSALVILLIMAGLAAVMTGCTPSTASPLPPKQRLRVATTTSLYDTGLWGYLEPMFEERYNVELDIMYAGTGKALEYGRRGDVDIITVHAKAREEQFIAEGYGVKRVPFAYNYFLIVGPEADPAGIKGLSPEEALKTLMDTGESSFISRGDDSGTHAKEKAIWEKAGYDYEMVRNAGTWYIEAGTGMGPTLMMANEKQAYTLTDMGTYLAYKHRAELAVVVDERILDLVPIVVEGEILLNVYSAIAVNPEKVSGVKIDLADNLIEFLISPEIQGLIGGYGAEEYGMQLFIPHTGAEPK